MIAQVLKYVLEGLAVAVAAFYISRKNTNLQEVAMIGLAATVTFFVLDMFAPSVASGARHGSGFGIGLNMVGGGPTPLPLRWFNPVADDQRGGGWQQQGGYETQTQQSEAAEDVGKPYKLKDGQYAAKVLMPGYNENIEPYNQQHNKYQSTPGDWQNPGLDVMPNNATEVASQHQMGGADPTQPPVQPTDPVQPAPPVQPTDPVQPAPPVQPTDPVQPAPMVLPVKQEKINALKHPNYRKPNALYSGDLIMITSDHKFLQRSLTDSQIILDNGLPKVGTNLSKLRFVHANKHNHNKQIPIKYGDPVHLMHNSYFNNRNESRYVKHGERMQSHQDGPLYRVFKIADASNPTKKGTVEPNTPVVLMRGDTEGPNVCLKVEADKSVSSKSDINNATKFEIRLIRVYELHDRNLCVFPNETLYP